MKLSDNGMSHYMIASFNVPAEVGSCRYYMLLQIFMQWDRFLLAVATCVAVVMVSSCKRMMTVYQVLHCFSLCQILS